MDESVYVGAEEWKGDKQGNTTFNDLLFEHIRRILIAQSIEMRGGFWITKTKTSHGTTTQERSYVPDTRETFGGTVDALHDLALPHFDKKMQEVAKKINDSLEQIKKGCLNKTEANDKEIMSSDFYKGKGDDKIIVEEYRFKKLRLKRQMWQELSLLLKRLHYFKGKVYEATE